MRQRDPLVHHESFQLVEDRAVGGVEFVGAESAAGDDHVDGQLAVQQCAHLHGRRVRTQHHAGLFTVRAGDEESVLHRPGRMVGQEVEGVEVVPLGFDLRPLSDLEAHADEDVRHPLGDRGQRVPGPAGNPVVGQGDVNRLLDEDTRLVLLFQLRLARFERLVDLSPGTAHPPARISPRRGRQGADLPVR